jgi:hypothetical protein
MSEKPHEVKGAERSLLAQYQKHTKRENGESKKNFLNIQ